MAFSILKRTLDMAQSNKVKQAFAIRTNEAYKEEAVARAEGTGHPKAKLIQARIAKMRNPRTGKPYGKERAAAIVASRKRKGV